MVETRSLKVSRLGDMTMDSTPLGESVREEALLDVVSLIEWHVVRSGLSD